jgi:hypothetical protein
MILLKESINPFITPYFIRHNFEYSEQVGVYRQVDGRRGEIIF